MTWFFCKSFFKINLKIPPSQVPPEPVDTSKNICKKILLLKKMLKKSYAAEFQFSIYLYLDANLESSHSITKLVRQ